MRARRGNRLAHRRQRVRRQPRFERAHRVVHGAIAVRHPRLGLLQHDRRETDAFVRLRRREVAHVQRSPQQDVLHVHLRRHRLVHVVPRAVLFFVRLDAFVFVLPAIRTSSFARRASVRACRSTRARRASSTSATRATTRARTCSCSVLGACGTRRCSLRSGRRRRHRRRRRRRLLLRRRRSAPWLVRAGSSRAGRACRRRRPFSSSESLASSSEDALSRGVRRVRFRLRRVRRVVIHERRRFLVRGRPPRERLVGLVYAADLAH